MTDASTRLIGPFTQLLTMRGLPDAGSLADGQLEIIPQAGIVVVGDTIQQVGTFAQLASSADSIESIEVPGVLIPGLVDAHTHLCFAGNRANDFAARLSGKTYTEIASQGGGIFDSVQKTRAADSTTLVQLMLDRLDRLQRQGITTCEIKSGYGLSVESELRLLEAIKQASTQHAITVVPTCLAAHMVPLECDSAKKYLDSLISELLPVLKSKRLTDRVDIFIDQHAFTADLAPHYLQEAKSKLLRISLRLSVFALNLA